MSCSSTEIIPRKKIPKRYKRFSLIERSKYEHIIKRNNTKNSKYISKTKKDQEENNFFSDSETEKKIKNDRREKNEGKNLDNFIDSLRKKINDKFNIKIKKIINFFDNIDIKFEDLPKEENPINLLLKLTDINNCFERNEIIDKIDLIVSNL